MGHWEPRKDTLLILHLTLWQNSKKPGKFIGKWNRETEMRKLNRTKQFEQRIASE